MGAKAIFIFLFLQLFLQISTICNSVPLSTSSRWIVNHATGKRVKLTCANWVSHLEPMIAEGLEKKPLSSIASKFAETGFNCVRFTWATFMFTRSGYHKLTVSQSLDKHNLKGAKAGIAKNNPRILNMSLTELHGAVVNELRENKLMVVLDNHVSKPSWCCSGNDTNGFFGDVNFDPNEWLQGLNAVAKAYKDNSAVVGMSLRNELRGNRQNEADWYKFMQQGAKTIHKQNPNLLVIISGLSYGTDLSFLRTKPLKLNLNNKLVYEAHWYTFIIPDSNWTTQTNNLCASVTKTARDNYLYLTSGNDAYPLFLSEFGIDERGRKEGEKRYMSCLLAEMADKDIDWALWTFQGSYMLRQKKVNVEEFYGVMDYKWDRPRNPAYLERLQVIRQMNQEPNSTYPTDYIIVHPQSGQCVRISKTNKLILANCKIASRWDKHKDGSPIKLAGNPQCLAVTGDGRQATISKNCSSNWKSVSSSGLHLATENGQGKYLCLEKNANGPTLVTKKCLCVGNDLDDLTTCAHNPQVQWFKLVPSNVRTEP